MKIQTYQEEDPGDAEETLLPASYPDWLVPLLATCPLSVPGFLSHTLDSLHPERSLHTCVGPACQAMTRPALLCQWGLPGVGVRMKKQKQNKAADTRTHTLLHGFLISSFMGYLEIGI